MSLRDLMRHLESHRDAEVPEDYDEQLQMAAEDGLFVFREEDPEPQDLYPKFDYKDHTIYI